MFNKLVAWYKFITRDKRYEELKNDRGDDSAKYEGDNKEDETI